MISVNAPVPIWYCSMPVVGPVPEPLVPIPLQRVTQSVVEVHGLDRALDQEMAVVVGVGGGIARIAELHWSKALMKPQAGGAARNSTASNNKQPVPNLTNDLVQKPGRYNPACRA